MHQRIITHTGWISCNILWAKIIMIKEIKRHLCFRRGSRGGRRGVPNYLKRPLNWPKESEANTRTPCALPFLNPGSAPAFLLSQSFLDFTYLDRWQNFTFIMQGGQNVRDCHPRFLTTLIPSEHISGGWQNFSCFILMLEQKQNGRHCEKIGIFSYGW